MTGQCWWFCPLSTCSFLCTFHFQCLCFRFKLCLCAPNGSSSGGFTNARGFGLGMGDHCPKLTPEEVNLLSKHRGCWKCCCFYVGHMARNCPNNFPSATGYTPLTEEMAMRHMSTAAIASTYGGHTFTVPNPAGPNKPPLLKLLFLPTLMILLFIPLSH